MQQRLPSTSTLYKLLKANKRSIYIVITEHTFVNYEVEKSLSILINDKKMNTPHSIIIQIKNGGIL